MSIRARSLVVSNDHTHPIPAAPFDARGVLPELRALMWVSSVAPPSLAQVIRPLPPLEFLCANVSGYPAVLRQLEDLTSLHHLELSDVRNAEVFGHLTAPLQTLEKAARAAISRSLGSRPHRPCERCA